MRALGASSCTYSSVAEVEESPVANSVTSMPASTRRSVRSATTDSVPPYFGGGTGNHGGAIIPIRISRLLHDDSCARPRARPPGATERRDVVELHGARPVRECVWRVRRDRQRLSVRHEPEEHL